MGTAGASSFNLGPRLTLTFAALIVLILGGNALVVWQFQMIRNETDRLTGANQQLVAVLRLQANVLSFHHRLDELARSMDVRRLLTEAGSLRATLREQTQQTRTAIANLPPETVVDPSFLPTLDTIDVTLPAEIEDIVGLARTGDWGAIQPRIDEELNPNEDQTAILVDRINRQASGELARVAAQTRSIQLSILIIVPATALSTFFIATFFGWSIARRFIELSLEERVGERIRIARELHDTLLQGFQGLMGQIQAAINILPRKPEKAKQLLEEAVFGTEQAIAEGRDAIRDLRPEPVAQRDLPELLNAAGKELAIAHEGNGSTPAFRVTVEGEPRRLFVMLQDEVYRIAREVIRNAFHHAAASRIEVEVHYDEDRLRLRIRDDGKGIDPEVVAAGGRQGHWGISGMRERAKRIGAQLDFWCEDGAGTEVQLTVPGSTAYEKRRSGRRFRLFRREGNDDWHPQL
jgi:signal transduction histidine kinase